MRDGGKLVGLGMATATYPAKRQPASALALLTADGTVVVQAATHEFGTGTYTSMSQLAAEALDVPVARIRFELGDSDFPENPISAGSMNARLASSVRAVPGQSPEPTPPARRYCRRVHRWYTRAQCGATNRRLP